MNRQIYKMTLADDSDSITFYLLEVPIVDNDIDGTATNTTIDGNVYRDYMWLKKQWKQKWSIMCRDEYDKLRGIFTRQYSDAEVATFKLFYGDNIFADGSEQGNSIQINNDSEVYEGEIQAFSLLGNTTQETLSGKNLCDPAYIHNGNFTTWQQVVDESWAETGNTKYRVIKFDSLKAGTYTLSINWATTATARVLRYALDGTLTTVGQDGNTYTFTTAQDGMFALSFRKTTTTDFADSDYTLQIESGSMATEYQEYCGGVPSPNPDFPQVVNTVSGEQTVKITGKNLWGGISSYSRSMGDIDFMTNSDGTITASGIATSTAFSCNNSLASSNNIYTTLKAGTYYLSTESTPPTGVSTRIGKLSDATTLAESPHSFTLAEDTDVYMSLRVASGTNISGGITVKPMLVAGSTAQAYEPYQATKYKLNLSPNLFDGVSVLENRYINTNTNLIASSTGAYTAYCACQPNTTYIVRKAYGQRFVVGTTTTTPALNVAVSDVVADKNAEFITITTGASASYLVVFYYHTVYDTLTLAEMTASLCIEQAGSGVELCKIDDYQDYIYKSGDKWYKHAEVGKVVFDGTEVWSQTSNTRAFYIAQSGVIPTDQNTIPPIISDYYTANTYRNVAGAGDTDYGIATHTSSERISIRNKDCADKTAFQTWLASHNTTVYYALATSTETEITDAELVGQLNALLAGTLYKGTNNIFLIPSAGADGTFTLAYRLWYEKETTVQDTTPVLLDLKDGGVINACGCRQNVEITMRETVQ